MGPESMEMTIMPARSIRGSLRLPGDKSISHRYALLAGLANGRSVFENFATGADCLSTLDCLKALGCGVEVNEKLSINGRGGTFQPSSSPLDCGNSGSTMRMLAGILAGHPFRSELRGDASLSRRPMARIIEPLRLMGADILGNNGCAPIAISGVARLRAVDYTLPVASAQLKSCVLFAGLFAEGKTCVQEPVRTRDHSELALRAFGAYVERSRTRVCVTGGATLRAIEAAIPGDLSTASFFLAAAALFPDSSLVFDSVLLNPTRAAILDTLAALGLKVSVLDAREQNGELVGTIHVRGGALRGVRISGAQVAVLIDELPVLAAIAPFTSDGVEINDANELRFKESDRLAAVSENLRRMGATVEELQSGLRIPGGQSLHGAEIDSFGDHRIAMAFAVAALRAQGESVIKGADAVKISCPEFFELLAAVTER